MTDIQKMIEEEAAEYAQIIIERISLTNRVNSSDFSLAVKHGANFTLSQLQHANRWRKVSEELPEGNKNLIIETEPNLKTQPVLIKTVGGGLFVDYRVNTIHENLDGWLNFWNWTRFNNNQVIEWKPIE